MNKNLKVVNEIFCLEKAGFYYRPGVPVLADIDLKIGAGEKVCILGANGTGKTTLLKLLSGLAFPCSGTFKAFGCNISRKDFDDEAFAREYHRKVGFIFQNSDAQLFCSTVREEIAFGPLQLKLPREEVLQRVEEMIRLFGLEKIQERPPFQLSGGEKKKVALAAVLAVNPDVLILDEPTNGLDPRTQRSLVKLLLDLNRAGKTILTSTHNLELVQQISDRAIVFDENHSLAADGQTAGILENTELLVKVNLIDDYYHRHEDKTGHAHYHIHNY